MGACTGGSASRGLEGQASCASERQARVGVYARDNTPGNALMSVFAATGLTPTYVAEGDCDEASYSRAASDGTAPRCGRDNAAFTVESIA